MLGMCQWTKQIPYILGGGEKPADISKCTK